MSADDFILVWIIAFLKKIVCFNAQEAVYKIRLMSVSNALFIRYIRFDFIATIKQKNRK